MKYIQDPLKVFLNETIISKHESRYPVEFIIVQPFYLMKLSRVYLSCLKLHHGGQWIFQVYVNYFFVMACS